MADQVLIQPGTVIADDIIAYNTVTGPSVQAGTITTDKVTASTIDGSVEVTGTATLDNLTATSITVQNDLTVEGNNTAINGEVMKTIENEAITMTHGTWYHNSNSYIAITVSPDVNSGTVKTCYIVTPVAITLTGATWLYSDIDMTDTTKTYVIALQQIGSTIVYANLAYSFPTA